MTRNNISMGCSRRQASRNQDRFARRLRSNRTTISLRVRGKPWPCRWWARWPTGRVFTRRSTSKAAAITNRQGCQDTFTTGSPAPTGGNAFSPAMDPIQQRSPSRIWIGSAAVKRSMSGPVEINGPTSLHPLPGNRSIRRSAGKRHIQTAVTARVATPPTTTAGTKPNPAAVRPDSNSPNSFEAPIKTALTALTRPRMTSGVSICTRRCRM